MKNLRLRQINGLINEWYSEDLSDNIRQILRDKMMRGQFIGSFACYGYTKDPAHLHSLIPDPPAAAVVREIYQLYLDGFSLSKIASLLTKKQVIRSSRAFYFRRLFLKIKSHMNLTAKFQNGLPQVYATFWLIPSTLVHLFRELQKRKVLRVKNALRCQALNGSFILMLIQNAIS